MKLHPVESSNLAAVAWQADGTLTVLFRSGQAYQYSNVERSVYLRLLRAESKGKFFAAHVRNNYEYNRVEPEDT